MSFNQLVDDLRAESLWRAGEPQDSTSSFWTKSLDYLNRIQHGLVLGGGIAVGRDLATSAGIYAHIVQPAITDWWWARRLGVVSTTAVIQTGTVTLTQGSATATFSSAPTSNIVGWRLLANLLPTVPRIQDHTPGDTTATLDSEWPEDSQTAVTYTLFKHEYDLPGDFLRFATPPYAHTTWMAAGLPVASREQLDIERPLGAIRQGQPTRAFLLAGGKLSFSSWDTRGYRMEFEYVALPASLQAGGEPILPAHYRPILAIGAAMLMTFDKADTRTQYLASEYREMLSGMGQEHRRAISGGSNLFGQFRFRNPGRAVRATQPMGELYLT